VRKMDKKDKSAPKIEADVVVKTIDRGGHLDAIADGASLQKVRKIDKKDASAPKIEADVVVKQVDRAPHLEAIATTPSLKAVETMDKSAPVLAAPAAAMPPPPPPAPAHGGEARCLHCRRRQPGRLLANSPLIRFFRSAGSVSAPVRLLPKRWLRLLRRRD